MYGLRAATLPASSAATTIGALQRAEVAGIFWRGEGALPPALPFGVPLVEASGPRGRRGVASLVAEDRDERDAAFGSALALLDWAKGVGGTTLLVRLPAPRRFEPYWERLRERHHRGLLGQEQSLTLRIERGVLLTESVDRARAVLDKLLDHALRSGCRLALTNPQRFLDLPSPEEGAALATELDGGPLQLWFDGPAAHLQEVMGLVSVERIRQTFDREGDGSGCFVGDACGPIGALAPDRGAIGRALPRHLGRGQGRVFSPWSGLSLDEALEAYRMTRRWLDSRSHTQS